MTDRERVRVVLAVSIATVLAIAATIGFAVGARSAPAPAAPPTRAEPTRPVDGRFAARVHALEARAGEDAADTSALLALGRTLHDGHRPAGAVRRYERILAIDSMRRDVWLDLADAHVAAGDVVSARDALDRFLRLFPGDGTGQYDRGVVALMADDTAAARSWWRRAAASGDAAASAAARRAFARVDGRPR